MRGKNINLVDVKANDMYLNESCGPVKYYHVLNFHTNKLCNKGCDYKIVLYKLKICKHYGIVLTLQGAIIVDTIVIKK